MVPVFPVMPRSWQIPDKSLLYFSQKYLVLYFLFAQFPTIIVLEICALSGNFWSEALFSVFKP